MPTTPTTALVQAVEALVTQEDASRWFDALTATARLSRMYPVALTGDAAVLNPLLQLSLADSAAFERVIKLVEAKRAAAGLAPLVPPADTRFDKTEYMRSFMDQKRQRQRRAVSIENMARSERDALRGRARLDFMDAQAARWKAELDQRIQRARDASGGQLTNAALTGIRTTFWQWLDDQLDEAEEAARRKMRRG